MPISYNGSTVVSCASGGGSIPSIGTKSWVGEWETR